MNAMVRPNINNFSLRVSFPLYIQQPPSVVTQVVTPTTTTFLSRHAGDKWVEK
jgi:hypothetical protein